MRPLTDDAAQGPGRGGRQAADRPRARPAGRRSGVERAVVNVHAFADQLEAHLAARTHLEITISDERGGRAGDRRRAEEGASRCWARARSGSATSTRVDSAAARRLWRRWPRAWDAERDGRLPAARAHQDLARLRRPRRRLPASADGRVRFEATGRDRAASSTSASTSPTRRSSPRRSDAPVLAARHLDGARRARAAARRCAPRASGCTSATRPAWRRRGQRLHGQRDARSCRPPRRAGSRSRRTGRSWTDLAEGLLGALAP